MRSDEPDNGRHNKKDNTPKEEAPAGAARAEESEELLSAPSACVDDAGWLFVMNFQHRNDGQHDQESNTPREEVPAEVARGDESERERGESNTPSEEVPADDESERERGESNTPSEEVPADDESERERGESNTPREEVPCPSAAEENNGWVVLMRGNPFNEVLYHQRSTPRDEAPAGAARVDEVGTEASENLASENIAGAATIHLQPIKTNNGLEVFASRIADDGQPGDYFIHYAYEGVQDEVADNMINLVREFKGKVVVTELVDLTFRRDRNQTVDGNRRPETNAPKEEASKEEETTDAENGKGKGEGESSKRRRRTE